MKVGVALGRFQILNLKHIEYILAAKMRCDRLFIGIEEPDILYRDKANELERGNLAKENPLTYIERYEMICQALLEFGMTKNDFDIIPFPTYYPDYLHQYIPSQVTYFLTVADKWDRQRKRTLDKLKLPYEVLWERDAKSRGATEKEILQMVITDDDWEKYVPKSTVKYMKKEKLVQKIKDALIE